jgi:shikimate dehydrogenase
LAAVIGDPVRHSLSPALHNAGFAELGLDWVFVALPVAEGDAPAAIDGVRALGIRGLSVTMPHKEAILPALDDLSETAAALRAVNCIVADGRRLVGHNTDGTGFVRGLRADLGVDPAGRRCVVVGTGGAARAVTQALAAAGAGSVVVAGRDAGRTAAAAAVAGDVGATVSLDEVVSELGGAELVVNATPIGMQASPGVPFPVEALTRSTPVVDLVYHPIETDLVRACRGAGVPVANGLAMLVHQAAAAFELWTGEPAPVDVMTAAALAELA